MTRKKERNLVMKKNVLGAIAVLCCALAFAARSQADAIPFNYSGDGVAVSGTLFGASDGNGAYTITGIAGTYNGIAIAGIVPLGADPSYIYNNLLYYPADPLFVDNAGILFNVPVVGDVNLYFDPSFGYGNITRDCSRGVVENADLLFNVPGLGDVTSYFDPSFGYGNITDDSRRGFVTPAVMLPCLELG